MPALTASSVLVRITSEVVQVPVPTITLKFRDVIADFYERTKLNRVKLASVDTVPNQPTYALPIPAGFFLVQVQNVRVNNVQLVEMSEDDLDLKWFDIMRGYGMSVRRDINFGGLDDPSWRTATATQPRFHYLEPDGALRLVAIPETIYTGALGILATVSLKPDRETVSTIDDRDWQDNADVFVAGVLARLLIMAEKPWSDPKRAAFWSEQYEAGVTDLAQRVMRSDNRNDREVYHGQCYA